MHTFPDSFPPNWSDFLKNLNENHDIDVSQVIGGLCDRAFSSSDYKVQFEVWLDKILSAQKPSPKGTAKVEGEEETKK